MATYPKTQSPSTSSLSGNGLRASPLESARRAQVTAMENRTTRRIEELLEESPEKRSRDLSKGKSSPAESRRNTGSPLLEYVKRSQIDAMASRTAKRISEVNGGFDRMKMDGDLLQSESDDDADMIAARFPHSPPSYFEAIGASPESRAGEFSRAPESAMRRNITQRRSRGRVKDEEDRAPDASRVSRRPRSRSKDRRYSVESTGISQPSAREFTARSFAELQNTRPARAMVKPKDLALSTSIHDLSQPTPYHSHEDTGQGVEEHEGLQRAGTKNSSPLAIHHDTYNRGESEESEDGMNEVFMKHSIPQEGDHPQLRDHLLQLWEQRQSMAVAMNVALFEDEIDEYTSHQETFSRINREMHLALRDGLRVQSSPNHDTSRTQTSSSVSTPRLPPDSGSESFSDPLSSQAKPTRWRHIDSLHLPLVEPIEKGGLKKSYKVEQHVFEIFLSYQGMEVSRTVNENLPLRILFAMAKSYLETDFHFRLSGDQDLDLAFDGRLLQRSGIISHIPIPEESVVMIVYPSKPHMVGKIPPSPPPSLSWERHPVSIPKDDGHHPLGQSGIGEPRKEGLDLYDKSAANSLDPKSYDKIRQSFKCPKFSGQARDWKMWDKGFWRYLSIWELEYVLDPSFFDELPLTEAKRRDNKLVYFIIEDAVQNSSLGMSYVRLAALNNGFEAYYTLHDGYVFAGATTATLLLNELSNFRFLPDESPTALCLRLGELFQELRDLPGDAAVTFIDTQKVGYLVNALRHEKEWDYVCSAITSAQIKGGYSFHDACEELKIRCEASRVNDLLDKPVKGKRVKGFVTQSTTVNEVDPDLSAQVLSLISTYSKKHNSSQPKDSAPDKKTRRKRPTLPCLAAGCGEETSFPLCPLHYHSLLSGKTTSVQLHSGFGDATYDPTSQLVIYPAKVPDNRLSSKQIAARSSNKTVAAKLATPAVSS